MNITEVVNRSGDFFWLFWIMTLIKKLGQIVEIIGLLIPASDHTVLKEYLHILTAESVNGIAFVPAK